MLIEKNYCEFGITIAILERKITAFNNLDFLLKIKKLNPINLGEQPLK